jgi:hypothetical protein
MAQIGGSSFFVKEKLATILDSQPKPSFLGAIILDSVMNYNSSEGSQVLPNGFEKVNKKIGSRIRQTLTFLKIFQLHSRFRKRSVKSKQIYTRATIWQWSPRRDSEASNWITVSRKSGTELTRNSDTLCTSWKSAAQLPHRHFSNS